MGWWWLRSGHGHRELCESDGELEIDGGLETGADGQILVQAICQMSGVREAGIGRGELARAGEDVEDVLYARSESGRYEVDAGEGLCGVRAAFSLLLASVFLLCVEAGPELVVELVGFHPRPVLRLCPARPVSLVSKYRDETDRSMSAVKRACLARFFSFCSLALKSLPIHRSVCAPPLTSIFFSAKPRIVPSMTSLSSGGSLPDGGSLDSWRLSVHCRSWDIRAASGCSGSMCEKKCLPSTDLCGVVITLESPPMLARFPLLTELRRLRFFGVLGPATASPRIARLASIRGVSRPSSGIVMSVCPPP